MDTLRETLAPAFEVVEHHYVNRRSGFVKKVFKTRSRLKFHAVDDMNGEPKAPEIGRSVTISRKAAQ